ISIRSSYMNPEDELTIIKRVHTNHLDWDSYSRTLKPILSPETIREYVDVVRNVSVEEPVLAYIRDLVVATRTHPDIDLGASSRASIALVRGGKGMAALRNRSYVIPDDIKQIAPAVLGHRVLLTREAEVEGLTAPRLVDEILTRVEVL
ncbi:MAG: MoxR family ATPase, partial [Methanoregula sp.]|nr:MoxR family ATPase [Methanoregula sp.]